MKEAPSHAAATMAMNKAIFRTLGKEKKKK